MYRECVPHFCKVPEGAEGNRTEFSHCNSGGLRMTMRALKGKEDEKNQATFP
jgi:hypothetical protein